MIALVRLDLWYSTGKHSDDRPIVLVYGGLYRIKLAVHLIYVWHQAINWEMPNLMFFWKMIAARSVWQRFTCLFTFFWSRRACLWGGWKRWLPAEEAFSQQLSYMYLQFVTFPFTRFGFRGVWFFYIQICADSHFTAYCHVMWIACRAADNQILRNTLDCIL